MRLTNATARLLNERNEFRNNRPHLNHGTSPPARFYAGVVTVGPPQPFQTLEERREIGFPEASSAARAPRAPR